MSLKLNFDTELLNFFYDTRGICKISDLVSFHGGHFLSIKGDFISKAGNDLISYIPENKLSLPHCGFDESKLRTTTKIGRFVTNFITTEGLQHFGVNQSDVETFVNCFKSYFDSNEAHLKIVSGDDILKYYLDRYYHTPNSSRIGSLWNSCMRYDNKNHFMKLYSENPEKVKMLVKLDEEGKVKTRALLWEDCTDLTGNKFKVMDRIYSIYEHDVIFFKNWAFKNGYLPKYEQSARTENLLQNSSGSPIYVDLIIKLDKHDVPQYPYLDSFKFYSRKNGTISNSKHFPYKWTLVQSNGDYMSEEQRENA